MSGPHFLLDGWEQSGSTAETIVQICRLDQTALCADLSLDRHLEIVHISVNIFTPVIYFKAGFAVRTDHGACLITDNRLPAEGADHHKAFLFKRGSVLLCYPSPFKLSSDTNPLTLNEIFANLNMSC
jgi:hypothetical protein